MPDLWHYTSQGKQMEPITLQELKGLLGAGSLKPTDMVWKEGMPRWQRASTVKELFAGATARQEPDAEPERPSRRRPAAAGSSIGIILALVFAALVLLGGLLVGIVILVVAIQPDRVADKTPKEGDLPKKTDVVKPLDGEAKYDPTIRFNEPHTGPTYRFKAAIVYEILVKRQPRDANVELELFVKSKDKQHLTKRVDGEKVAWAPPEDGSYWIELENKGERDVIVSVSIRNTGRTEEKEDPLPKGVQAGKGQLTTVELMPGDSIQHRFRVKGGHAASFVATCLAAKAGSDINIYVTRDADNANEVYASDTRPDAHAKVEFARPATEIVRLRIENASKTVSNKCHINYNVSP